jgi:hypothetical protein
VAQSAEGTIDSFLTFVKDVVDYRRPVLCRVLLAARHAADRLAHHCYVCGRVSVGDVSWVHACANELCRFVEVDTLRYVDLRTSLREHGALLHLLLTAAVVTLSQPDERRMDLFDPVPADYQAAGVCDGRGSAVLCCGLTLHLAPRAASFRLTPVQQSPHASVLHAHPPTCRVQVARRWRTTRCCAI